MTNADLSFSTRLDAAAAPQQMRDRIEIETATGLLAARSGTDLEVAQRLLREAAVRAGVPAGSGGAGPRPGASGLAQSVRRRRGRQPSSRMVLLLFGTIPWSVAHSTAWVRLVTPILR